MLDIMVIPSGPFQQNTRFLVNQDTKEAIVVDPADAQVALSVVETYELKPVACFITHGHIDHISGVGDFVKNFKDIKLLGPHVGDEPLIKGIQSQANYFGLEACPEIFPEYLEDGQVLDNLITDTSFKVIHTPGHSLGSICFYCEAENFIIVGDTLFQGSVGRTDLMGGNTEQLFDSIKTKLLTLPENVDVMCGHGEDTTIGYEKAHNPYILGKYQL